MRACDIIKECLHILFIALMVVPETCFYNSINILSGKLSEKFDGSDISTNSYTIFSVLSIFATVGCSLLIDVYGTHVFLIPLKSVCIAGCVTCALAENTVAYYTGVVLYSIAGESVLTAQSKLAVLVVQQRFHSAAFAMCFCGYMFGEAIAGWLFVHFSVSDSYFICVGLLAAGYVIAIFYTVWEAQHRCQERRSARALVDNLLSDESLQNEEPAQNGTPKKHPCKSCLAQFRSLKLLPSIYWLAFLSRICFMSTITAYNAQSMTLLSSTLHLDTETAALAFSSQQIVAAVSFVVVSFLMSLNQSAPLIAIFVGQCLSVCSFFIFTISSFVSMQNPGNLVVLGFVVSVLNGVSVSLFAANSSSILIRIAGSHLAAVAVGFAFSMQFLVTSGYLSLSYLIMDRLGASYVLTLYFVVLSASFPFLLAVMHRMRSHSARPEVPPSVQ